MRSVAEVVGCWLEFVVVYGTWDFGNPKWIYLFHQSGYGANRSYTLSLSIGEAVYEVMPVAAIFLASSLALVVVSLMTPRPSDETLEKFFPPQPAS